MTICRGKVISKVSELFNKNLAFTVIKNVKTLKSFVIVVSFRFSFVLHSLCYNSFTNIK